MIKNKQRPDTEATSIGEDHEYTTNDALRDIIDRVIDLVTYTDETPKYPHFAASLQKVLDALEESARISPRICHQPEIVVDRPVLCDWEQHARNFNEGKIAIGKPISPSSKDGELIARATKAYKRLCARRGRAYRYEEPGISSRVEGGMVYLVNENGLLASYGVSKNRISLYMPPLARPVSLP